jgi:AcrR family transcriptional regulator
MNTRSSPATRRTIRHRLADRALLLEAAERAFAERGYHGTAMRDIARASGFSVGGVYQFYDSKDDLYLEVLETQWEDLFRLVTAALGAKGFLERLEAFTGAFLSHFEAKRAFFRLVDTERAQFSASFKGAIRSRVHRNRQRLRKLVVRVMREGVAEDYLRRVDVELMASAYLGILHHTMLDALESGRPLGKAQRLQTILSVFLCGVSRPGSRTCSDLG